MNKNEIYCHIDVCVCILFLKVNSLTLIWVVYEKRIKIIMRIKLGLDGVYLNSNIILKFLMALIVVASEVK